MKRRIVGVFIGRIYKRVKKMLFELIFFAICFAVRILKKRRRTDQFERSLHDIRVAAHTRDMHRIVPK